VKTDAKYLEAARQRVAARVRRRRWADALFQPQPVLPPIEQRKAA
jgi:hypothetical protein